MVHVSGQQTGHKQLVGALIDALAHIQRDLRVHDVDLGVLVDVAVLDGHGSAVADGEGAVLQLIDLVAAYQRHGLVAVSQQHTLTAAGNGLALRHVLDVRDQIQTRRKLGLADRVDLFDLHGVGVDHGDILLVGITADTGQRIADGQLHPIREVIHADGNGGHQNAVGGRSGVTQEGHLAVLALELAVLAQRQTAALLDGGDLAAGDSQLHFGASQPASRVHVDAEGHVLAGLSAFGSCHTSHNVGSFRLLCLGVRGGADALGGSARGKVAIPDNGASRRTTNHGTAGALTVVNLSAVVAIRDLSLGNITCNAAHIGTGGLDNAAVGAGCDRAAVAHIARDTGYAGIGAGHITGVGAVDGGAVAVKGACNAANIAIAGDIPAVGAILDGGGVVGIPDKASQIAPVAAHALHRHVHLGMDIGDIGIVGIADHTAGVRSTDALA